MDGFNPQWLTAGFAAVTFIMAIFAIARGVATGDDIKQLRAEREKVAEGLQRLIDRAELAVAKVQQDLVDARHDLKAEFAIERTARHHDLQSLRQELRSEIDKAMDKAEQGHRNLTIVQTMMVQKGELERTEDRLESFIGSVKKDLSADIQGLSGMVERYTSAVLEARTQN